MIQATHHPLRLEPLESSWLNSQFKGWPLGATALRVRDIAEQGWNALCEDVGLPIAADSGWAIEKLSEQQAHMRVPASCPLAMGDLVGCGISHPYSTFDKRQWIALVNDNYDAVSAIRTFF